MKKHLKFYLMSLSLVALSVLSPSLKAEEGKQEEETTFLTQSTLTGNWGGLRQKLVDKGVNFELNYTADFMGNAKGGVMTGSKFLHNIDMALNIDAEKLMHWKGGSLKVSSNISLGNSPSELTGDRQGPSNINGPDMAVLYEAWVQQNLWNDKVSILAGLYDVNSDFDSIDSASLFLNSSQGMGYDIAQTGLNGPSAFPYTALGARLRVKPSPGFYIQTAFMDGVPGDPGGHERSTQIKISKNDGAFIITEAGYNALDRDEKSRKMKFALGGWYYTSQHFNHLTELDADLNPVKTGANFGLYGLADFQITREKENPSEGLSGYVRAGYAAPSINPVEFYVGGGLVYSGPFSRSNDQLGVALGSIHYGNEGKTSTGFSQSEYNIEFTYKLQATPWFSVQPDIQYIINPSGNASLGNALLIGSRFSVAL